MPRSDLQSRILLRLAAHRSPESYVAGATVLNRAGPRYSDDIFPGREDGVAVAATEDAVALTRDGLQVDWLRREPGFHAAVVKSDGDTTRLEWARDSDFRFFPTIADATFGFRLHVVDIATNKALAAAGRREPRDVLDLLFIHDTHLPLGAVIWVAVGKEVGFSPECLIAEIRRNARYRADDYADFVSSGPIDAAAVARRFKEILNEADGFVRAMPSGKEGLLLAANLAFPFERFEQHYA